MNEVLCRRYSALLRVYPQAWRDANSEELMGTLDELSGNEQRWPSFRQSRSLLVTGWRTRVRASVGPEGFVLGDAAIPSVLLLLGHVVMSVTRFSSFDDNPGRWLGVMFIVPFLLLVRSVRRWSIVSIPVAGLACAAIAWRSAVGGPLQTWPRPPWVQFPLFLAAVGVGLAVLLHQRPELRKKRSWSWVVGLALTVVGGTLFDSIRTGLFVFIVMLSVLFVGVLGFARIEPRAVLASLGFLTLQAMWLAWSLRLTLWLPWVGQLVVASLLGLVTLRHARQVFSPAT